MAARDTRNLPDLARLLASFSRLPHVQFLGMRCDEIGPGRAKISAPYQERLIGNSETGVIHGGVITAMLDTVGWLAVATVLPEGIAVATLDLRVDYLRPARPGLVIRASAACCKLTSSVAFSRGTAYHDRDDDPIAHLAGTYMLGSTGFTGEQRRDGTEATAC